MSNMIDLKLHGNPRKYKEIQLKENEANGSIAGQINDFGTL